MTRTLRTLAIFVSILGFCSIVIGGIFIFQGFEKNNLIVERMETEKVTLAVDPSNPDSVVTISNANEAQQAADLIAGHRRAIAPTYQDLLGGGRFDPTNPQHITYAQAMNLENYLYLAVTAFGLVQVVLGTGAFMVIAGAALVLTGLVLYKLR